MEIPDKKLRKELIASKSLEFYDIIELSKDEFIEYIKKRICVCIILACLDRKRSMYIRIRDDCDESLKSIFPEFKDKGIEIKIEDKDFKYQHITRKDGIDFTATTYDIYRHHVLYVTWD